MKKSSALILFLFLPLLSRAQDKKWTLDECLDHALQHNIDVIQSKLQEQSSRQDVVQAIGSFLPRLSISIQHNRSYSTSIDTYIKSQQNDNYSLSSNITLFDGLKNLRTLNKANIERDKARQMTDSAKLKLTLDVTEAFINILYNKDSLHVSEEQLNLSKQSLEQVEKKYRLGAAAESDVTTAEAQWASEEKNRVDARNSLSMSKIKLALLLQLNDIKDFDISEKGFSTEVLNPISTNPEELVEKAFQTRPELKAAKLTWESNKKQVQIVRGNYWPQISLGYSFEVMKPPHSEKDYWTSLWDNRSNNLGLSVSFSLFDKLNTKTNVEKAKINQEIALYNIEKTKNQLRQALYEVHTAVQGAYAAQNAAQKAEAAAKLSFEYARKRYREGMATAYDHNNAKNQWIQTQYKTIQAKYDYILKTKILNLYTTELLNP